MNKHVVSLFLGMVILSVLVVCGLFLSPDVASAGTAPTPVPEKDDISRNRVGRQVQILSSATSDLFGYVVSTITPAWMDATSGTEIGFGDRDDDQYGPISIGFDFPFYENTYSELFVTTNGLITFGLGDDEFVNRDIPRDTLPNDMIAPFWDDLLFVVDDVSGDPISRAYYTSGSDGQGNYFVVEWYQVARLDTQADILTFEVVLRDNGDILFQYDQLTGTLNQATVGIEDDQGVDGSVYVYNSLGLSTSDALLFTYPAPSAHSKIYPLNRGGLTSAEVANLHFTVRNNGDLGADTYDLSLSSYDPTWMVVFLDSSGNKLTDSDGDGKIDTGLLAQGVEKDVFIRVRAPQSAQIGEYIDVVLSVASSLDPTKEVQATFQAAVPTSFALAVLQREFVRLRLIWQENQISVKASLGQFFGSNLALQRLKDGNYLYSWEDPAPDGSPVSYADLKFTILSDLGGTLLQEKNLTDNSSVVDQTTDRFLVSDIAPNGLVGVAWVHSVSKWFGSGSEAEFKTNQNVYFAVLDESGNIVVPVKDITQNTGWRGEEDLDIPYIISPRISATEDNRFVIAWRRNASLSGGEVDDIEYMVFSSNGTQVKGKSMLTSSQPDGVYYIAPSLVDLTQNCVLLSYSENDPILETSGIVFQVLDSNGNIVQGETSIANSNGGSEHDSIRFKEVVLLAWPSTETEAVGYILLDGDTAEVVAPTQYMISPNLRETKTVSVARDSSGRGVIVWADRMEDQYMYYALVSSDGSLITPEMSFMYVPDTFVTNSYGYGLTSYEGTWQAYSPLISR